MISLYQNIITYFNATYSSGDEIYNQPQITDIQKDFPLYSFVKHYPEKEQIIQRLFSQTVNDDDNVSIENILQEREFQDSDELILKEYGFEQLNDDPNTESTNLLDKLIKKNKSGIILQHSDLPGWLIKKNYVLRNGAFIFKTVSTNDFPLWMLPSDLQQKIKPGDTINLGASNAFIHLLRPAMLKRGRQWIKKLDLNHLKACKEYLYLFPHYDPDLPRYCHYIVLSKKENLLSQADSLRRFAELAKTNCKRLQIIAHQICVFIKHTLLTDMYICQLHFLDDDTDTIVLCDGEPIGAMSEISDKEAIEAFKDYDTGFFALLGLKELRSSLSKSMDCEKIDGESIKIVQDIFNKEIKQISQQIIAERRCHQIKATLLKLFLAQFLLNFIANIITAIYKRIALYFRPASHVMLSSEDSV